MTVVSPVNSPSASSRRKAEKFASQQDSLSAEFDLDIQETTMGKNNNSTVGDATSLEPGAATVSPDPKAAPTKIPPSSSEQNLLWKEGAAPTKIPPSNSEQNLLWKEGAPEDEASCGSNSQTSDSDFLQNGKWISTKRRYCLFDAQTCRRGELCTYAHNRGELANSLTEDEERAFIVDMPSEFYMNKFKTIWCPYRTKHDWHVCPYMHNYSDARRPISVGYSSKNCPDWQKAKKNQPYTDRCPRGFLCPYVHSAGELLYHPDFYKTTRCLDYGKGSLNNKCPRGRYCAFHHSKEERRTVKKIQQVDPLTNPICPECLPADFHVPVQLKFSDSQIPPEEQTTASKKIKSKKAKRGLVETENGKGEAPPAKHPTARKSQRNKPYKDRIRPDRVTYGPVDFASCMPQQLPAFWGPGPYGDMGYPPPNMMMPMMPFPDMSADPSQASQADPTAMQCIEALEMSGDEEDGAEAKARSSNTNNFYGMPWNGVPMYGYPQPPNPGAETGGINVLAVDQDKMAQDAVNAVFGQSPEAAKNPGKIGNWADIPPTPSDRMSKEDLAAEES